jgi:DNA-binding XRE family transcriptional regulator
MAKSRFVPKKVEYTPEMKAKRAKAWAQIEKDKGAILARARQIRDEELEARATDGWRRFLGSLREERQRQGLSLDQLSEATGISKPALSNIENGVNNNPKINTVQRIAAALGKIVAFSLGGAAKSR